MLGVIALVAFGSIEYRARVLSTSDFSGAVWAGARAIVVGHTVAPTGREPVASCALAPVLGEDVAAPPRDTFWRQPILYSW